MLLRRSTTSAFCLALAVSGCFSARYEDITSTLEGIDRQIAANPPPASPGSLCPPGARALCEDAVARRRGDVVTILISENLSAKRDAKTTTSRETDIGTEAFKGLDALALGGTREFTGEGSLSRTGSLATRMAARVVNVGMGGALRVAGLREVEVDGDMQIMVLTGIVRPEDIGLSNTVHSQSIAELRLAVVGRGTLHDATKRGWVQRVFDWLNVF